MSAKSDKFEEEIAFSINLVEGIKASRPKVSTKYADVKVEYGNVTTWIEVKENHSAQLGTPRFYYESQKSALNMLKGWKSTSVGVELIVNELNKQKTVADFVKGIASSSGIPLKDLKMYSTKGGVKKFGSVPYNKFIKYAKTLKDQYIMRVPNFNIGKVVDNLYHNKQEPAYYMQSGDDFYRIGENDPFNFGNDVPLIKGMGELIVRFSPRTSKGYYEFMTELKIPRGKWPHSKYSFKPGTKKLNPFFPYS